MSREIAAVSFDFFNTLAAHRNDRGRGALLMEYFRAQGWNSDPWEHAALYDVFAAHHHEFGPMMSDADLSAFAVRVARTLFGRLHVAADRAAANTHGVEIWRILGPQQFAVFPDATTSLRALRAGGYRLAVVSNWQHGLGAMCGLARPAAGRLSESPSA
jgi:FMN phosphatase YigB (HAD superfamily)